MKKHFKTIISAIFLAFILYSLAYKNIISPEDNFSIFARIADMAIPLFMLFSVFLMFLKRREDNKDKLSSSKEDREFFSSIGKPEDFDRDKKK